MRPVVVVIVLPLTQLLVEQVDVVADAVLVDELVELLVVDAMRALDFAIEPRRSRPDVHVPDVELLQVPVELRLKLGAVVRLDDEDAEWQSTNDLVGEANRGRLRACERCWRGYA